MRKEDLAEKLFRDGYNCAQAVVGAFCEELNLPIETVTKMISGFGGGIGRMRETCGAVSGMVFVLSALEISLSFDNAVINAMLCALFLVFSWYIVEKMYQKISGENFENEAENENDEI